MDGVLYTLCTCAPQGGSLAGGLAGLAQLAHTRRVTTRPSSASLRLEPLLGWLEPRGSADLPSTGSSFSYEQWRESYVPGRGADTFTLLSAREACPLGALLRSTRWIEWPEGEEETAAPQVWP